MLKIALYSLPTVEFKDFAGGAPPGAPKRSFYQFSRNQQTLFN